MKPLFLPKHFLIKEEQDAPWVIYYLVDTHRENVEVATLGSHIYEKASYEEIDKQFRIVVNGSHLEGFLMRLYQEDYQKDAVFYDLWTDQAKKTEGQSPSSNEIFSYIVFENVIHKGKIVRREVEIG